MLTKIGKEKRIDRWLGSSLRSFQEAEVCILSKEQLQLSAVDKFVWQFYRLVDTFQQTTIFLDKGNGIFERRMAVFKTPFLLLLAVLMCSNYVMKERIAPFSQVYGQRVIIRISH
jgi:hypothetical protein